MTLTSPAQTAVVQVLPLAKELDENKVTPGVLGFIVFAAMGAVVWMLMKSMHRHMQKVDFEETPPGGHLPGAGDGDGDETAAAASPAPSPSAAAPSAAAPSAAAPDGKSSGPGV